MLANVFNAYLCDDKTATIQLYKHRVLRKSKIFYCTVESFLSLYRVKIVVSPLGEIFFQKWFYSKNYEQPLDCDVWVDNIVALLGNHKKCSLRRK